MSVGVNVYMDVSVSECYGLALLLVECGCGCI